MQLDQLEGLLAVLEHGSIAGAARALGRRRATLQEQLDELEQELDAELLLRGPGGAEPTRAGEAVAARARAVLAEVEALRKLRGPCLAAQTLRVIVQPGLPPELFAFSAALLRERLPHVQPVIEVGDAERALADPAVDLICRFDDALPDGAHRTFINQRYPIRLLASRDYLRRRGRPRAVADLADHDLLAWTGFRPERDRLWPRTDGPPFPVAPRLVCNDTHALRFMAAAGLGLALVADARQARGLLPEEDLEAVLEGVVEEEGRARVIIPTRAAASPAVRAFIELLRFIGLDEHSLKSG